jgi:hypothetical protein
MTIICVRPFAALLVSAAVLLSSACTSARTAPTAPAPRANVTVDQAAQRSVIRAATAEVVVESVAPAHARVTALTTGLGGRVDRDVMTDRSATLVLRIPDARLEAAVDSLALVGDLRRRSITAQDITAAVIDLDARIASLVATRDRLRELQVRATTVTEVVEVERELARIQGELDSLEGRRAYLREAAALSQLEVELQRRIVLGPIGVVGKGAGWVLAKLFVWRR